LLIAGSLFAGVCGILNTMSTPPQQSNSHNNIPRVGVFTANRAEYGLLAPLIAALHHAPHLTCQLFVAQDHWLTGSVAEIEADGYPIDVPLKPLILSGQPSQPGERMALLSAQLLQALATQWQQSPVPAVMVILGDRFEAAACALACRFFNIPIIHIGGGDVTAGGCVDDDCRDVITRLASRHCVATHTNAQRLHALGVNPATVTVTGALVGDNVANLALIDKTTLFNALGLNPDQRMVLFTQHPIPAEGPATVTHFADSVAAMAQLPIQVLATWPNQDGFGNALAQVIEHSQQHHSNIHWVHSLGRLRYLSAMAVAHAVVGNTSSGLLETPYFAVPSVTIGPRQNQRQRGHNVLACPYGAQAVYQAIQQVLTQPQWQKAHLSTLPNPFGSQPAAPLILNVITLELGLFN
jgi:GDP/UDP-N,N'-diacetylbacillosamine 2-epimerase (hydrolysing)